MDIKIDGNKIIIHGDLGTIEKEFNPKLVKLEQEGDKIKVTPLIKNKVKAKQIKGTYERLIEQMKKGVTEGYTQYMEVVYSHFPINLELKGNVLLIKNLYGEKIPREAKIVGNTKVEIIGGKRLKVHGIDKYEVFQTVANIMNACRQTRFDPRVFQDGIYPVEGEIEE